MQVLAYLAAQGCHGMTQRWFVVAQQFGHKTSLRGRPGSIPNELLHMHRECKQPQDLNSKASEEGSQPCCFGVGDNVHYTTKQTKQNNAQQTGDTTRRCEVYGRQDRTDGTKQDRTETSGSDASTAFDKKQDNPDETRPYGTTV